MERKQELTDKIEGLLVALKATIDQSTVRDISNQIQTYALEYKQVTGEWYRREWK
jgi:hypothetical protein